MNLAKPYLNAACKKIMCIALIIIAWGCQSQQISMSANDINVYKNVTYATFNERKIKLDLYQPKIAGIYPGVVLVHGGGWIQGTKKGFGPMALELAKKGYVVANIDYRLSKEAIFPAAVQDTKAAIRWLRSHAKEYQVDVNNIAGIGGSAGGHLIAMAALTGHSTQFNGEGNNADTSGELQAVIILGSGVDQVKRAELAPNMYIKTSAIFFGATYLENPSIYALGSPISHITENTPPILMLDGEYDRPGERYVDFMDKLKSQNIEHEFKVIKGAKHADWKKEPFRTLYIEAYDRFMKKQLINTP